MRGGEKDKKTKDKKCQEDRNEKVDDHHACARVFVWRTTSVPSGQKSIPTGKKGTFSRDRTETRDEIFHEIMYRPAWPPMVLKGGPYSRLTASPLRTAPAAQHTTPTPFQNKAATYNRKPQTSPKHRSTETSSSAAASVNLIFSPSPTQLKEAARHAHAGESTAARKQQIFRTYQPRSNVTQQTPQQQQQQQEQRDCQQSERAAHTCASMSLSSTARASTLASETADPAITTAV